MIHIHAGGTTDTLCGVPVNAGRGDVSWSAAHKATCVPCAEHFGRRVLQFGPEWLAHVLAGGTVLSGNLLVNRQH